MIALDTNVLIYCCDSRDPRRQEIALDLVAGTTDGISPWQVACEFIAASRKLAAQGLTSLRVVACRCLSSQLAEEPPTPPFSKKLASSCSSSEAGVPDPPAKGTVTLG